MSYLSRPRGDFKTSYRELMAKQPRMSPFLPRPSDYPAKSRTRERLPLSLRFGVNITQLRRYKGLICSAKSATPRQWLPPS